MKILAIETSCDETAIALVEARGGLRNPQFQVVKNVISSQVKVHRPFGGVVPSLAKREHLKNLPIVFQKAVYPIFYGRRKWDIEAELRGVDLIAVTVGPGLEPALWTGINFAKDLARQYKKPLLGVNHLEGHLYSLLLSRQKKAVIPNFQIPISKIYPAIALIVSGGHTILIHQKNLTTWKKIGETRDDAAGEAFDKVARLLGLPYPGGPALEKLALGGESDAIEFPRPMIHQKNYDFSFSGLKTAVLYYLKSRNSADKYTDQRGQFPRKSASSPRKSAEAADTAASFQQAIIDVLTRKTIRAANEYKVRSVILAGGVATNKALRKRFQNACRKNRLRFFSAEKKYQTDNGTMIAVAAYINYLQDKKPRKITSPRPKQSFYGASQSRGKRRLVAQSNLSL